MDFTDFVGLAGVVKDALGCGRLPGINVGHDADVAIMFERGVAGHVYVSVSSRQKATKTRVDRASHPGPVSIRRRRVQPPLMRSWGLEARRHWPAIDFSS
jgi:hypothetical protein